MKIHGEYITVAEMVFQLKTPTETIKARLKRLGIKPLSRDALYPSSALDAIRDVTMGRPKKESKPAPDKKPSAKARKPRQKKPK